MPVRPVFRALRPGRWAHGRRPEGSAEPARKPAAGREAREASGLQAGALPRTARGRRKVVVAFAYRGGRLHAEDVPLEEVAERFGTPCYVYSSAAIRAAYGEFADALRGREALVCYSVKANSNLAVLAMLARLGAGFDIVSGGELARVLAAGADPGKVVFSGVGKSEAEIEDALRHGIGCINLESASELERVDAVARRLGKRAPVAFRVNPDIDARTHPYISTGLRESKFGVAHADAPRLYAQAARLAGIEVLGIGCHIGSLLADAAPFVAAADQMVALVDQLERAGIRLRHVGLGGGMGIRPGHEGLQPPLPPPFNLRAAPPAS